MEIYFKNQLARFYHQQSGIADYEIHPEFAEWMRQRLALRRTYQKPWYEFHAVQLLDWIVDWKRDIMKPRLAKLGGLMLSGDSGQLGRLIEQYSWRFRFEGAAIAGLGARLGASAGGKAKARQHHDQHSIWQNKAVEVWGHRPGLSKMAVADLVRKECAPSLTAKHIARFIRRP